MVKLLIALSVIIVAASAQQKSINLDIYKNNKNFAWAETSFTAGKHQYSLINIKNLGTGDTGCISAIVLDKRKFIFTDLVSTGGASGLLMPKKQPLTDGVIVFKGSPIDSKTFIFMASGKLVTIPGSMVVADPVGKALYCVWDNDGQYRLTMFDLGGMRVLLTAVPIAKPVQWFTDGIMYGFKADDNATYIVDPLTREVRKGQPYGKDATPSSYIPGFDKVAQADCCSQKMFGR